MCQDLATEVEQHRDIYLALDSTGKKLVSGLDTQEDATLLHTRLEQMNQRWSDLKAKSIAIRYIIELQKRFIRRFVITEKAPTRAFL